MEPIPIIHVAFAYRLLELGTGIFQACDESGDGVLTEEELHLGVQNPIRHSLQT